MTTTLTAVRPVEVGDIFSSSWGYDQTNVDWYAVTAVSASGKTATFTQVAGSTVEDHGPGGSRVTTSASAAICAGCQRAIRPLKLVSGETVWAGSSYSRELARYCYDGRTRGDSEPQRHSPVVLKRRIRWYSGEPCAKVASYANMYRWNGESKYATSYGFGH